jgi:outer membrane protein TolC
MKILTIYSCIFLLIVLTKTLSAQQVLTLKECYEASMASNALAGEKKAYSEISALRDKNITKGWMPTIDLNGNALYNSSVIDLSSALGSLPFPGIENAIRPLPNDQYKITLDINQVIYDGGAVRGARAVEKADLRVNEKQTETDLYKLRSQINAYYFNLLLIDRHKELLEIYNELIDKRLQTVRSGIENGVMLRTDADVLASEQINIRQQLSESEIRKNALMKVLADLTGITVDASTELVLPVQTEGMDDEILRPELQLFDLRKEQLAASEKLIASRRLPKAFGFASLGYGNPPGNNFFRDEFDTYYIMGAGVKWNIFDWHKAMNEKQAISLQSNIVDNRKKDLTDNIMRQLGIKKAEIISLEKMIESDEELVLMRKRITASAESQHQNGTITATEYLNILNAERQALINSEIHKINLSLARIEYLNISGKEIE